LGFEDEDYDLLLQHLEAHPCLSCPREDFFQPTIFFLLIMCYKIQIEHESYAIIKIHYHSFALLLESQIIQ
jgi:hypothetical protein